MTANWKIFNEQTKCFKEVAPTREKICRLSIAVKDPCDRLITIGFCMSTKMLTILAIVAQETSMLAFSLERAYATTYPRSYEKCQTPSVGIFVGILSIFLAVGVKYGLMLPGLNFSEKTASYEVIFAGNAELFQVCLRRIIANVNFNFRLNLMYHILHWN